jgi:cullin 1
LAGTGNVKATFNKKSYELVVVTLQMVILMAFNAPPAGQQPDNDGQRSYEQLAAITNLPDDVLKRVIHSLTFGKYKILKRVGATGGPAVKNTDTFQFNDSFSCPMRKIRIPMASLEDSHNTKKVEEDRR